MPNLPLPFLLLSLIGPVYFAINGWPVGYAVAWAVICVTLRCLATWDRLYPALYDAIYEGYHDQPAWWHPYIMISAVILASTAAIALMNVLVFYWALSMQPPES